MAKKVASLYVKFDSESAALLSDMRRVATEAKKMGRRVDREANRIKYAFNKIRRAAQVVASAFIFVAGVRQLGNLVSAMAKAEDRVKLLDARFKQFARAGDSFTRVYNLSKELGVSLDETAGGMTRLLVATKSIGTAQSTLEDVYKNIVLLGRAGGTSTEEMIGGMRQLSQGLASGRLQGEELRSVLENLPLVAMEIAKEMKIGIGQIRKAAAEGKITGEVVIAALSNIGIKMEDLPTTWAMQTENLRTEWGLFLADLSKAVDEAGLLSALVEAVKWVRMDVLGGFAGVSTEELKRQQKELKDQIDLIDKSRAYEVPGQTINPIAGMASIGGPFSGLTRIIDSSVAALAKLSTGATFGVTEGSLRDRYREVNDELVERVKLEELASKAAAVRGSVDNLANQAGGGDKALSSFLRQYETIEQKVTRLQAQLEGFKGAIIKQFGEGEFKRIAFEIDKDLIQMIDTSLIPKLKEIPKAVKESTEEMSEASKRAAQNIQDAFADFLFDPFEDGVKGMLKSFLDAIRRMIAETAAAEMFGEGSGFSSFIKSIFHRASGGPVGAGGTYLVGERGPELLTMGSSSGFITPNHKLSASGGTTINYNIEAGADVATIMSMVIPALERTKNAAVSEVIGRKREGKL